MTGRNTVLCCWHVKAVCTPWLRLFSETQKISHFGTTLNSASGLRLKCNEILSKFQINLHSFSLHQDVIHIMVHLFNRRRWIQIFKPAWQWSEHWIQSQETQVLIPACYQHSLCHRSHFPSLDHILTYKLSGEASWSRRSPPVLTPLIIWPEPGDSHCRGWGFLEQFSWSPPCQKCVGVFYSENKSVYRGWS